MAGNNPDDLEAEMSRFEQELMGTDDVVATPIGNAAAAGSFVIGVNTFTRVQDQLTTLRAQVQAQRGSLPLPIASQPVAYNALSAPVQMLPSGSAPIASTASVTLFSPPAYSNGTSASQGVIVQQASSFVPSQLSQPVSVQQPKSLMEPSVLRPRNSSQQTTVSAGPIRYYTPPTNVVEKPRLVSSIPTRVDNKPSIPISMGEPRKRSSVPTHPAVAQSQHMKAASTHAEAEAKKRRKDKKFIRTAADETWEDTSLAEWDPDDFRVFCGDLGNEVTEEKLSEAFKKYPSFQRCKVVRDRKTNKTKGYGFISFSDPGDYAKAMREMNGKYVGNRPIKLRKSNWKDRSVEVVKKKEKEKKRLGFR